MSVVVDLLPPELRTLAANEREYPRQSTVHALFEAWAHRRPDAIAAIVGDKPTTYRELDEASNRIARLLLDHGLRPEGVVGVMLERSVQLLPALLGVLKAGGAYCPINDELPGSRVRTILRDAGARFLLSEARHIRAVNRLQWECPDLDVVVCLDHDDFVAVPEPVGEMMRLDTWQHIRRGEIGEISGGGFRSSYTGELLSDPIIDEYAENIVAKLAPHLDETSRILEIGSASGISMFRLAPRVAAYVGTDFDPDIVEWSRRELAARGIANARVECLAADEIGRLDEEPFDVVIFNSVMQCFSGHNYLRGVLRQVVDVLGDEGWIFCGNVWDEARREAFERSLVDFAREHAGEGHRTKVDRSEDLFLSAAFFDDLRHDRPEIREIDISPMLGQTESELSLYGYDVLARVDKRDRAAVPERPRHKHQLDRRDVERCSAEPIRPRGDGDSLAYLMYTSGTTGQPKGVMIEHHAINRLVCNTDFVELGPDDRVLLAGSVAFDASTYEIWGALANGGAVVIPEKATLLDPTALRTYLVETGVTTTFVTASLFNTLTADDPTLFGSLRSLLVGGERLSPEPIERVRRACPDLKLLNGYGPTENTTFTCCHRITGEDEGDIPIGRPIANTRAYVLRTDLSVARLGEIAELFAAGDGLARGYHGDEALTTERFVTAAGHPGERLYRTGDLARFRADGVIEYHGRADRQVKVRGFRIELGDVESHILRHSAVRQVVVVDRTVDGTSELVAYLTADADLDTGRLRADLERVLPRYMVPAHLVQLTEIPLTPNGKVDQAALPAPEDPAQRMGITEPPATELEKALVTIWEEVLGHVGLGVTEDFFELGGDSLKVTKVAALARKRAKIELPLTLLYRASTIRELASELEAVG